MPRKVRRKFVLNDTKFICFKQVGVLRKDIDKVELFIDKFEVFKLANYEGLFHIKLVEKIKTSPASFNGLVKSSEKKIADFFVNGKGIRIFKKDGTFSR